MYRHSGPLSKVRGEVGSLYIDTKDLYPKVSGEVGTQCRATQDFYLKVRGAVGSQCSDTQALYLKVRGVVGDSVQTLRSSIRRSERRWENVYTYSGLLSKGQRGGG